MSKVGVKVSVDLPQSRSADAKATPKQAKSAFDDVLAQAAPAKPASSPLRKAPPRTAPTTAATPTRVAPVVQTTPSTQSTAQSTHLAPGVTAATPSDDAVARNARLLAVLQGVPLTQLVSASPGFGAEPMTSSLSSELKIAISVEDPHVPAPAKVAAQAAAKAAEPDVEPQDGEAAPVQAAAEPAQADQPEPSSPASAASKEPARFAVPAEMTPVNEPAAQPPVDPAQAAQVVQVIAAVQEPKPTTNDHDTRDRDVPDVSAVVGATRVVAAPAQAVHAVVAPQEAAWHGLAEKIADLANNASGSIEGQRARIVLGQGDDRVVLSVSTHAQRVAIDVDTSTRAGSQLAEALRSSNDDLRQALGRHGLELDNGRSQGHDTPDSPEPGEAQSARRARAATSTTTATRRSGVVLA